MQYFEWEAICTASSWKLMIKAWGYHFETLGKRIQRSLQSEECLPLGSEGLKGGDQANWCNSDSLTDFKSLRGLSRFKVNYKQFGFSIHVMFNHQCLTHVKITLGSSNVCKSLVVLNGKLHWSSSFVRDKFGLPIPNSNLGRAAWAPRSGLFGGSAAVAWRHHVTWHRWYMRGFKVSVALYEIDIILMFILILFRFYWWPFLNNRQYRWLNEFSFEPERSLLICPMFWSISALVRAVQKVEGRLMSLMSCLSRSIMIIMPNKLQGSSEIHFGTHLYTCMPSCIWMYHSFIVHTCSGIRWGHPKRWFAQGFVLVSWKSRLVIYWNSMNSAR